VIFDETQTYVVTASENDSLWIFLGGDDECNNELDIDETFKLNDLQSVAYYNKKFYVLANKFQKKLGYFLLEMDIDLRLLLDNPDLAHTKYKYIIKWINKLNIGDAQIFVTTFKFQHKPSFRLNKDRIVECNKKMEIVSVPSAKIIMSFKTIYENTYTIMVVDRDTCKVLYKHVNYQLWESPVSGFLSTHLNDFIILNKDGMSFVKLGNSETKMLVGTNDGI
jgi:hypothetical protein